jgi:pentatricopeptide repeat protein
MMQSLSQMSASVSATVPMVEDYYLFCFFWVGFLVLKHLCGNSKAGGKGEVLGDQTHSQLQDDFSHRRYEKVLTGWARLEQHTPEALALVVSALLALGRPDDIGFFVAQTTATLPHLKPGLHLVVAATAAPACEVRRQHVICALRDLYDRARGILDKAALKELLLALARFNDEVRVADLLVDLADASKRAEPELLGEVVRSFLSCQNLDAALAYLQQVLAAPCECPHALIIDVVKASTEAELGDDCDESKVRPKAWHAFEALKSVKLTKDAALLFLEWSARQTPIEVAMAAHVEELLRKTGMLPMEALDILVRVHASSAGDEAKAFLCFDEFVKMAETPSEASLVGMISSCVEACNGALAEHIFSWAHAEERCTLPILSATLKVLAASNQAERVCAVYQTASVDKELVLDEVLMAQIADCAEQAGHTELARKLVKGSPKKNVQNPLTLIRACAQEGDVDQVLTLLEQVQQQGQTSTPIFNAALDVCVSAGHADAVKTVRSAMQSSGHLDVASYNILLKQCLSEHASPEAAEDVLREMRQRNLEPNTATYNSLLSVAITAGDFTKVWKTVDDLESSGQGADIYTLSILFKGHRREKRTMDSEVIRRSLDLINRHSVKLDENFVNIALEACLALRDTGCLKKALATFWDSGWNIPQQAATHTYGNLIKAYGQIQSLTEAWQLWTELTQDKGMVPTEQLYGQMLDVLVANNRLADALTIFEEMKTAHKDSLSSIGFGVAYGMIIRGFAQQKDCEKALQCYEEMKGHGTKASLVVLNTLMDACSRVGDMRSASRLFKDMTESKLSPDLITYSTMIKGYCISEDLEQALRLFGVMQEKGIRPDAIVFNSLLDGCAKKQVPGLCEQVIKDMESAGVVPSNYSASILIKLYGRCKDLDAAFRVINEMPQKYGFKPNNAVYTCLMSACIADGQLDKALELRTRMIGEGVYPDDRTYSTLLRGALRASSVEKCVMLVDAALNERGDRARQLLDEELLRSVLVVTQRQNEWETQGRELSNRLRSCGINVRLPLPSDSCARNDGFGRQVQRESKGSGKGGNFGGYRDQAPSKDSRYSQQYQQQRRY